MHRILASCIWNARARTAFSKAWRQHRSLRQLHVSTEQTKAAIWSDHVTTPDRAHSKQASIQPLWIKRISHISWPTADKKVSSTLKARGKFILILNQTKPHRHQKYKAFWRYLWRSLQMVKRALELLHKSAYYVNILQWLAYLALFFNRELFINGKHESW